MAVRVTLGRALFAIAEAGVPRRLLCLLAPTTRLSCCNARKASLFSKPSGPLELLTVFAGVWRLASRRRWPSRHTSEHFRQNRKSRVSKYLDSHGPANGFSLASRRAALHEDTFSAPIRPNLR